MEARRARMDAPQIAAIYGVTERLVDYRLQMTGVEGADALPAPCVGCVTPAQLLCTASHMRRTSASS